MFVKVVDQGNAGFGGVGYGYVNVDSVTEFYIVQQVTDFLIKAAWHNSGFDANNKVAGDVTLAGTYSTLADAEAALDELMAQAGVLT